MATPDITIPFARSFRYSDDKTLCPPRLDQGFDELRDMIRALQIEVVYLKAQQPRLSIHPAAHPNPRGMDGRIRNGWLEVYSPEQTAWIAAGYDTAPAPPPAVVLPTISYGATPHENALVNDRWRNPADGIWYDFIPGNVWVASGSTSSVAPVSVPDFYEQETPPNNPQPGWRWFKPSTGQNFTWAGGAWIEDE